MDGQTSKTLLLSVNLHTNSLFSVDFVLFCADFVSCLLPFCL